MDVPVVKQTLQEWKKLSLCCLMTNLVMAEIDPLDINSKGVCAHDCIDCLRYLADRADLKVLYLMQHVPKVCIELACPVCVIVHAAYFASISLKGKLEVWQEILQGCTQPLALHVQHKANL